MAKSKGLSYEQLNTAFQHQNFKPLYFLYGEEEFLMSEVQDTLIANALAPGERDFNLDIVYGADTEGPDVRNLCTSYPVMAPRRVVIVRDFDKLKDNRLFKAYAEQPNPQAVVLLVCGGKPNLSAHPYRALREHGAWAHFKPLYDNQVPGWIRSRAKAEGYTLEPQAVQMLAEFVGNDLRAAAGEIEKIATYAGTRTRLTADDVIAASGQTREFNVFELQNAIGEARLQDALRIGDRMLEQAANPTGEALKIVAVLNSYLVKLWKLTACQQKNVSQKQMARRAGISPYFVKEYLTGLRHFPLPAIETGFSALLAADFELKGGAARDPRLILTLMLRRLVP